MSAGDDKKDGQTDVYGNSNKTDQNGGGDSSSGSNLSSCAEDPVDTMPSLDNIKVAAISTSIECDGTDEGYDDYDEEREAPENPKTMSRVWWWVAWVLIVFFLATTLVPWW